MSTSYKTPQEKFWSGEFGNDYIERNKSKSLIASKIAFLANALKTTDRMNSCIEFGANIGLNLAAMKSLFPEQEQYGLEINAEAAAELSKLVPPENVYVSSLLDFVPDRMWDLVLVKGVLIHINPDYLPQVYDTLIKSAGRYILIGEYYNPTPIALSYRGHEDRLFKRDFAGELLDRCSDLRLIDYGFAYHRDPKFPEDDINWFLLEK